MKIITALLIVVILYYLFRAEWFTCYDYVKLYNGEGLWATYSSADGKYLNYMCPHDIDHVVWRNMNGEFELWGYVGAGNPEIESIAGYPKWQRKLNPNWELLIDSRADIGEMEIVKNYPRFFIEIKF
jgi:hypothetical protein